MSLRRLVAVVVLGLVPWSVLAWPVLNGEYTYWPQMPTGDNVRNAIVGGDKTDQASRRHAAFSMLLILVAIHRDGRGEQPRPEREKILGATYSEELADSIRFAGENRRLDVEQRSFALQADPVFTRAFLERHFSRDALQQIDPVLARMRDDAQRAVDRSRSGTEAVQRASATRPFQAAIQSIGGAPLYLGLTLLLPVLLLLLIAREFLPHGLDRANSTVGRRGLKRYIVERDTGAVANSAGRYVLMSIDGRERDLEDPNGVANLHVGQVLSVMWALLPTKTASPYLLFRDHRMRQSTCDEAVVRRFFAPSWWPVILLGPMVAVWSALASDFLDIGVVGRLVALTVPPLIAWPLAFVFRRSVAGQRVRRFEADVKERIAPELDRRAMLVSG